MKQPRTALRSVYQPTEDQELIAVFDWSRAYSGQYPQLRNLFHIPNEGKRSIHGGHRMKWKGLSKGYPDIALDIPAHGFHGLRIELKVVRNRPRIEQSEWLDRLTAAGYMAVVCVGAEATIETIAGYLSIRL